LVAFGNPQLSSRALDQEYVEHQTGGDQDRHHQGTGREPAAASGF
jgi:hypothetical protein